jgi:DNA topoisomerase-1
MMRGVGPVLASEINELHDDARRCAEVAGLVYVDGGLPGIGRRRAGTGFSYHDAQHRRLTDAEVKERIAALAIPPAWKKVWICPDADGHILATGEDERGRKQYIYHPQWRTLRDLINFYRLIMFSAALPKIRKHYRAQLRRRTLDADRVIAAMIAILDATYIRIGNDVYAEENESFGLSTLTAAHVRTDGHDLTFAFPAKSNKDAEITITDAAIVRLVRELMALPGDRLFVVDGEIIDSDHVNQTLLDVSGEHITAKDFRTWGGTLTAFTYLRARRDTERPLAKVAVEAVDEAADALGNTRTVARAHYVHPHVLETFTDRTFEDYLRTSKPARTPLLETDERALAAFLQTLFTTEFSLLKKRSA